MHEVFLVLKEQAGYPERLGKAASSYEVGGRHNGDPSLPEHPGPGQGVKGLLLLIPEKSSHDVAG